MSNTFYNLFVKNGSNRVEIHGSGLTANYALGLPVIPPDATNTMLEWDNVNGRLNWVPKPSSSNGTLTSIGLTLTTEANAFLQVTNSPLVSDGNITIDVDSQAQNLIFASPSGSSGKPAFIAISDSHLPSAISASKISGTLPINTIPNGTNSASFQLSSASSGNILNNVVGGFTLTASDGITLVDLNCRNINITGEINQSNVTILNVQDQEIVLLSGFNTGTPTLNGGINLLRGSSAQAQVRWNETVKKWQFGTSTNLLNGVREETITITSASLVGGNYTWSHNFGVDTYPNITVIDNAGIPINIGVTHQAASSSAVLDFTRVSMTGTWTIKGRCG